MPTIETIFVEADLGQSDEELETDGVPKALEAMSREGVVDESTLRLVDVNRDGDLDFGNGTTVDLKELGLVAVKFSAEAEPHKEGN